MLLCVFSFANTHPPRIAAFIVINITAPICVSSSSLLLSTHTERLFTKEQQQTSARMQQKPRWSLTLLLCFFLKHYVHLPGWSQECKCATLLTFTNTTFCLRCSACGCRITCDDCTSQFRRRTYFDNHKQSTSSRRIAYVNVSYFAQLHSSWPCCHMYVGFNSNHCNEVSSTTSPTSNTLLLRSYSHTPPFFVVPVSFFFLHDAASADNNAMRSGFF